MAVLSKELKAISLIQRTLSQLTASEKGRVMDFVVNAVNQERYGKIEKSLAPEVTSPSN